MMQLFIVTLFTFSAARVIGSTAESHFYQNTWDEPASLQTTTDDKGNKFTKTLWWVPPSPTISNEPHTIVTSAYSRDEYTSSNSQLLFTPSILTTTTLPKNHERTSASAISYLSQLSSSIFPSNVAFDSSSSITTKQPKKTNATVEVLSNGANKIIDKPYGIGAVALAIVLI